ncbi:unnamed protein product [Musa banksii]
MEDRLGQKQGPQVFPSITLSHLSSSAPSSSAASAFFSDDRSGCSRLRFHQPCSPVPVFDLDLQKIQIFKLGLLELLCVTNETGDDDPEEKYFSRVFKIGFNTKDETKAFHLAFEQWKLGVVVAKTGGPLENGSLTTPKSKFDNKIDATSAKMYFHYYGQLLHQQNMLQDYVRTGTYYAAVIENRIDFSGRIVLDVGAGSGILSLFAAQAGAKHVYAVEASEMAEYARRLIAGNPSLGQRITVIKGKIEEVDLPEKADILISEPMGTLLVNERMLETYVIARDRFLIPDGKMFPSLGRIHMAPFSDEYLYVEIANKALFWQQHNYYGVDLTSLYGSAFQGYFSQPVVDAFDPRLLISQPIVHTLDFTCMKEEDLYEIDIPLNFVSSVGTRVHGLACWFDVLFNGSSVQRWLTTAPGAPTTHWYQLRCVLAQPIYVMAGQEITGRFHLVSHNAQSYTIYLTLSAKTWGAGADQGGILQTFSCKLDLKEPYYRLSQPLPYILQQDQQSNTELMQSQELSPQIQDGTGPSLAIIPSQISEASEQQHKHGSCSGKPSSDPNLFPTSFGSLKPSKPTHQSEPSPPTPRRGNMSRRYSRTIYVGNLPGDIREREVEDLFNKYGPIIDIDLKIPPRPPGYAFIEFEDPRDADDAIRGRDGYNFDGHRLRVELAHGGRGQSSSFDRHSSYSSGGRRGGVSRRSEYRVMVTGLPSSASWQDLKDHMRRAGDVCFSEVFRDGGGTIGIVDYTNYDDMKYAIRKLDDSEFRNAFSRAYIRVKEYDSKRSLSRSRSRSRSYSRSPTPPRSRSRSRSKSPRAKPSRHSLSRSRSRSASSHSRSASKGRSLSRFGLKRGPLDCMLGSELDMVAMLATFLKGLVAMTKLDYSKANGNGRHWTSPREKFCHSFNIFPVL